MTLGKGVWSLSWDTQTDWNTRNAERLSKTILCFVRSTMINLYGISVSIVSVPGGWTSQVRDRNLPVTFYQYSSPETLRVYSPNYNMSWFKARKGHRINYKNFEARPDERTLLTSNLRNKCYSFALHSSCLLKTSFW